MGCKIGCREKKSYKQADVILPTGTTHQPEAHEQSAAYLLANHFNCKVEFIPEHKGYKVKTADIVMRGVEWEIKSPTGNSRKTIPKQFERAKKQSKSVVLDIRRTRLTEAYVLHTLQTNLKLTKRVKRIILINKKEIVCTIK